MQEGRKVGDRVGVLRDLPEETHTRKEEKAMNKNLRRLPGFRDREYVELDGFEGSAPTQEGGGPKRERGSR